MSQMKIYNIIKELGGKASSIEIREVALKKYPKKTLHKYILNRLYLLRRNGIIKQIQDGTWVIVEKNPKWETRHKVTKFLGNK